MSFIGRGATTACSNIVGTWDHPVERDVLKSSAAARRTARPAMSEQCPADGSCSVPRWPALPRPHIWPVPIHATLAPQLLLRGGAVEDIDWCTVSTFSAKNVADSTAVWPLALLVLFISPIVLDRVRHRFLLSSLPSSILAHQYSLFFARTVTSRWRNGYSVGLAINRLWVQILLWAKAA